MSDQSPGAAALCLRAALQISARQLSSPLQWLQVVVPLTALAGKQVQIRFRLDSLDNKLNMDPGWFVDDLEFAVVGQ